MSEIIENKTVFTLLEVTQSIQLTLARRYSSAFWVKAEMNKLNHYPHSGHCYPDLVQREQGKVVAQLRSVIWNSDFNRINAAFLKVLQEPVKDGISILFSASITYDPVYGISLRIHDIDPVFTLGDLEREKNETIERLKSEGIFNLNKNKSIPVLPKRIAIISVKTSKGYADFLKITESRMKNFKMEHFLFESVLQGEQAIYQIINRMRQIEILSDQFDLVAIIRGGGGDVGLASFNNYELSKTIATFPLPVITGIGHATNMTVSEMVAHTNAATPSELADVLMERFENFDKALAYFTSRIAKSTQLISFSVNNLKNATDRLSTSISFLFRDRKQNLDKVLSGLDSLIKMETKNNRRIIDELLVRIKKSSGYAISKNVRDFDLQKNALQVKTPLFIQKKRSEIEKSEHSISLLDPLNILKRGYSMTLADGKIVKDLNDISENQEIQTILADGEIKSKVIQKNKNK